MKKLILRDCLRNWASSILGIILATFRFFFRGQYTKFDINPEKRSRKLAQKNPKIDRSHFRRQSLIGLSAICSFAAAQELPFPLGIIEVENERIHAISSFDQVDYLTTYSLQGEFLWEIPFSSRITTTYYCSESRQWPAQFLNEEEALDFENSKEARLYVFSQARDGSAFFLSTIDPNLGTILWERTIRAPQVQ